MTMNLPNIPQPNFKLQIAIDLESFRIYNIDFEACSKLWSVPSKITEPSISHT